MTLRTASIDGQGQPVPPLRIAAPGVRAVVDQRALELVQEIAVGAVELDGVEADVDGAGRCGGKIGDDAA